MHAHQLRCALKSSRLALHPLLDAHRKIPMTKTLTSLVIAVGALVTAAQSAQAAIVVSLTPSSQHVNVGDTVTINASISGLGSDLLATMDLDLLFNSAVLGNPRAVVFNPAEFGGVDSFFDVFFNLGNTEVQGGSVLSDPDLAAVQTDGAFQFLSYSFTALADGTTNVNYGPDPVFERNFVGLGSNTLNLTIDGSCVSVGTGVCNVVAEPSSFGLVGLALAGLVGPAALRRRARPQVQRQS